MQTKPKYEADRFREFTKQIMSVPKSEIDRREKEYQKQRQKIKKSGSEKKPD
jgi:hypothetical protein